MGANALNELSDTIFQVLLFVVFCLGAGLGFWFFLKNLYKVITEDEPVFKTLLFFCLGVILLLIAIFFCPESFSLKRG